MRDGDIYTLPDEALSEIRAVLSSDVTHASRKRPGDDAFVAACRRVAQEARIELPESIHLEAADSDAEFLARLADKAAFRFRRVALEENWWRFDNGPLLVFRTSDHRPCAAVRSKQGHYELIESGLDHQESVRRTRVDEGTSLKSHAFTFYRIFPQQPLSVIALMRFGLSGLWPDLRVLFWALGLASLLGLIIPITTGLIVDSVIPRASLGLLAQLVILLSFTVLALLGFNLVESVAVVRLRLKLTSAVQAAVWDRLVRLPLRFFRRFTAGDLAERAAGIDEIQETLSGNAISVVLSGAFSLVTFGLMAYYDLRLAALAAVMTAVYLCGSTFLILRQLGYERRAEQLSGQRAGFLVQVLSSIAKLRVAGAEEAAFSRWMHQLTEEARLLMAADRLQIWLSLWSSTYLALATATLFLLVVSLEPRLSVGSFVAFSVAYAEFLAAVFALGDVVSSSLGVIPLFERARPILNTRPEDEPEQTVLPGLNGDLEVRRVSFRYRLTEDSVGHDSPWVLDNVSLDMHAGELVGLVGPSGSGKSTLFQLLLAFERPEAGAIYYDGHDLSRLNPRALRRRLGVVLQHSTVTAGTVEENILGNSTTLTQDDAWRAAQAAGIGEEIEAMPMQMHTMVAEGGRNFSAGQRQCLLLARALVKSPRLLLLDEATSHLDNETQAWVFDHLKSLGVSCMLAAHRLSTLRYADQIYVLDRGRIVQSGSYEELLDADGLFAVLAERQLDGEGKRL